MKTNKFNSKIHDLTPEKVFCGCQEEAEYIPYEEYPMPIAMKVEDVVNFDDILSQAGGAAATVVGVELANKLFVSETTTEQNEQLIEGGFAWAAGTAVRYFFGKDKRVNEGAKTMSGIGLYKVIDGFAGDNIRSALSFITNPFSSNPASSNLNNQINSTTGGCGGGLQ